MKQPKKSKTDTSPIIITTEFTREEIERFSEEWTKLMHKQQPIMIHKDTGVGLINTEPTTKKEMVRFNYEGCNVILEGEIVKTYKNEYIIKTECREYIVNKKDVHVNTETTTKKEMVKKFEIKYYVEEYSTSMVIVANDVVQIDDETIEADGIRIVLETSFGIESIKVIN